MRPRSTRMADGGWRGTGPTPLSTRATTADAKAACALIPHPQQRGGDTAPFGRASGDGSTWRVAAGFLLLVTLCLCAQAQSSVDWSKLAGGGGTSTGGVYSVSGTIGQPEAGAAMTGGNYSVTGGFWSLIAVAQMPGAPTLTITHSGNSVIVSWPYPSSGYRLQQNGTVAEPAGWSAYGGTVNANGGVNSTTLTPPVGSLFFRLYHP